MKGHNPNPDARNMEEAFFAKQNARYLEQLRKKTEQEERREALRQVVRVDDDAFLDRLITLGLGPETVLALRLIPLVFVAWADGSLDEREREAVLKASRERGLAAEEMAASLLEDWLAHKPDPGLLEMWKTYMRRIWDRFTEDEQLEMRKNLLGTARDVAEAAGGLLGLIRKISPEERAVLDELEQTLR